MMVSPSDEGGPGRESVDQLAESAGDCFRMLDGVRQAAGRWAASLGTIIGVSGVLAIGQGRSTVAPLDHPWDWIVGALIGLALGLVLAAIGLAFHASRGSAGMAEAKSALAERLRVDGDREELRDLRDEAQRIATADSRRLTRSIGATFAGVIAVAIASAVVSYAPAREPMWLLTGPGGADAASPVAVFCGALQTDATTGRIDLLPRPEGHPVAAIPVHDATKLTKVDGCPAID